MQALGTITSADLLAKVRKTRYKFELYDGAAWQNLMAWGSPAKCLVKDFSFRPSGAGILPDTTAGTWSAEVRDPQGLFNPFNSSSTYKDYFQVGRKVRISVGLEKAGVKTFWTRFIGYIESSSYDLKARTVSISGADAMRMLAAVKLGAGSRYWGTHEHFTSVATGGTGTELYDEGDACEVGAGEGNNVTPWVVGGSGGSVASVAGDASTFALLFTRDIAGTTEQYAHDSNIFTMTAGQQYIVTLLGQIAVGTNYARVIAYETIGGAAVYLGETTINYNDGDETPYQIIFTPKTSSVLQLRVSTGGKYAEATDAVRIDNISVKTYDPNTWYKYDLNSACNGIYAVTYDGDFVEQGDADALPGSGKGGWHYEDTGSVKRMCFSKEMQIEAGKDIAVYYFTDTILDDIVADLLVSGNLYLTRALAKAAMDYVGTGITISRARFEEGTSALAAIQKCCERANYRFWISHDEAPTFKPAPVEKVAADFNFPAVGNLSAASVKRDQSFIRNRITIEGEGQAVEPSTPEKLVRLTGEASDTASITAFGEVTYPIRNDLFQDVAAIAAVSAALLDALKDEKQTVPVTVPFCAIPFEMGDTIVFQAPITNSVSVEKRAIIRDINVVPRGTTLSCDIVTGYPAEVHLPDIGACENQKSTPPGPIVLLPDIGACENQKT